MTSPSTGSRMERFGSIAAGVQSNVAANLPSKDSFYCAFEPDRTVSKE